MDQAVFESDRATTLFSRFADSGEAMIDTYIDEQISEELFID